MKYKYAIELNELSVNSELDDVIEVFKKFKSFYRNTMIMSENLYLFRSRLEDEEFPIIDKQELSYIGDSSKVKMGRANAEKEQVFYGATNLTLAKIDQDAAAQTAILEGSKKRREENENDFVEYGYLSRWKTTKSLKLFSFLNFDFGSNAHPKILESKHQVIDNLKNMSKSPNRDIEINHWIASIFAYDFKLNDKNQYKISSLLSHNMMKTHDGILYPSVQTDGIALNFALNKAAADTLTLERIIKMENFRQNGITGVRWGPTIEFDKMQNS